MDSINSKNSSTLIMIMILKILIVIKILIKYKCVRYNK